MPLWLMQPEVCDRLEAAIATGLVPSAEQQAQYETAHYAANAAGPRILKVNGSQATIDVTGILTGAPDFMAKLFGGGNTTYAEIIASINAVNGDPNLSGADMFVSSPGGEASAEWFASMEAVANSPKPINAIVGTMAASAAYGIVSQAKSITAKNKMSMVGSVGVVSARRIDPNRVDITSTEAPNKRPDISTDAGKAAVREEIDAIHKVFVDTVATGRGTTAETVNTTYGRGGMVLAADAVERGMIDRMATLKTPVVDHKHNVATRDTQGAISMDLAQLKKDHPEVFAQAVAEGVTLGVTKERDRVCAHLIMGEASGAVATATKAVKEGTDMTATLQAEYLAAGMNRTDSKARATEDEAAAAALAKAKGGDQSNDAEADGTALLAALEELGLTEGE